jgi:mannose-6-phosphate isomerase-like protein (cupin superfamily)
MERVVRPGDVVLFPADTPQKITNVGENDLIFLVICYPRFIPESYLHLEHEL